MKSWCTGNRLLDIILSMERANLSASTRHFESKSQTNRCNFKRNSVKLLVENVTRGVKEKEKYLQEAEKMEGWVQKPTRMVGTMGSEPFPGYQSLSLRALMT